MDSIIIDGIIGLTFSVLLAVFYRIGYRDGCLRSAIRYHGWQPPPDGSSGPGVPPSGGSAVSRPKEGE